MGRRRILSTLTAIQLQNLKKIQWVDHRRINELKIQKVLLILRWKKEPLHQKKERLPRNKFHLTLILDQMIVILHPKKEMPLDPRGLMMESLLGNWIDSVF